MIQRSWRFSEPIERVWRALTERDEVSGWLLADDFAPRVGHRFTVRGGPGRDSTSVSHCEVLDLDPPRRLVIGWSRRPGRPETVVELTLRQVGEHTELRIEHRVVDAVVRAGAEPPTDAWSEHLGLALAARLRHLRPEHPRR